MPDWWIDEEVPTGPRNSQFTQLSLRTVTSCDRVLFRDPYEEGYDIILDTYINPDDIAIGATVHINGQDKGAVRGVHEIEMNIASPQGDQRKLFTRLSTRITKINFQPRSPRYV